MKLFFYIKAKGRRCLKFDSASELDEYIKTHKLPADAFIVFMEDDKPIGNLLIKNYLHFEKQVRPEILTNN
jgi:hypothetical protein